MRLPKAALLRVSCLALLATLWHALMPLVMALPMQQGVVMTLCSTAGSKAVLVRFDTPGAPDPAQQPVRCPLCVAGAHFGITPVASPALPLLAGLVHVEAAAVQIAPAASAQWPHYLTRAPPSSV